MSDKLSDAWQCQSCSCYFPHIPKILDDDVKRCSKCVEVEILEAGLSEMEEKYMNAVKDNAEVARINADYLVELVDLREQIERAMEAMGLTWGDLEGFGGAVEGICDTMEDLRKRVEELEDGLGQIVEWSKAYPLDVFPEPDFKKAAELLKVGGMTLDAISASNMRHVVEGVGGIAKEALHE